MGNVEVFSSDVLNIPVEPKNKRFFAMKPLLVKLLFVIEYNLRESVFVSGLFSAFSPFKIT